MEKLESILFARELISSIFLMVLLITLRVIGVKVINGWHKISGDNKRIWVVHYKNFLYIALILSLIVVWATQLQTFAISVVAVAAALVLATKELIQNLLGGIFHTITRPFKIGDRIEISGVRGDVIDHNFLSTTILEVGPGLLFHQYTGRSIDIPNSVFLGQNLINESFTQKFVVHTFTIPIRREDDWKAAEKILLESAYSICKEFIADAKIHMDKIGRTRNLEPPSVDPRLSISFPSPEILNLVLRVPAPASKKGKVEQAILREFLEKFS